MALNVGRREISEHVLQETKRDDLNEAFANLEKCKQASTSKDGKQLQQVYFNACQRQISYLEGIIEMRESETEKLKRIRENMKTKFEQVKESHQRSYAEQTFGKTARSRSRSRSRSRDREEEEIEKKAMELFAIEREMYDEEKKIYIQNPERHWRRLPPSGKNKFIKMVNTSKGGRTRKNKK